MPCMKKYLLLTAFAAAVLASCSKDDPVTPTPTPTPPTKTELLAQKRWKLKTVTFIRTTGDTLQNVRIVGSENWRIQFKSDSTGIATGTIMQDGNFTWSFSNATKTAIRIVKSNTFNYNFVADSLLTGSIPNLTLTLVDGSGNPVGTVTGTLNETYNRE